MKMDSRLKDYVESQRTLQYEGLSLQRHFPRMKTESVFSVWRAKLDDFFSPLFPPQVAWAMGLCLLAGAVLVLFRPERIEKPAMDEFTAKGSTVPFQMRVGNQDFQPEQSAFARAGDTMSFLYRSLAGAHVQIWYQDDGGEIKPYLAPSSGASSWLGVSAWHEADYKVVLFSDWNKESVWILWSDQDFTSRAARKVLEGEGVGAIQKVGFHLVRTP